MSILKMKSHRKTVDHSLHLFWILAHITRLVTFRHTVVPEISRNTRVSALQFLTVVNYIIERVHCSLCHGIRRTGFLAYVNFIIIIIIIF